MTKGATTVLLLLNSGQVVQYYIIKAFVAINLNVYYAIHFKFNYQFSIFLIRKPLNELHLNLGSV